MTVDVKICGIMTPEHGRAAVAAGADFVGLVFAPSKRRISLLQARKIVAAVRAAADETGKVVGLVGVFVNEQPETINRIADEVGLDWAQLSGHEEVALAAAISRPVIKAIRFDRHPSEAGWLAQTGDSGQVAPLLIDAHVAGSFGGAGVTGDWEQAAAIARQRPTWLAGGLTPENVAAAVRRVQPNVVDVSSGVESGGVKDVAKIQVFIYAAKRASLADLADTAQDARSATRDSHSMQEE
ncbi:MAG TPA: phosphoribosylanthranilate isomerase [Herpetosiphonaceae bacterium]